MSCPRINEQPENFSFLGDSKGNVTGSIVGIPFFALSEAGLKIPDDVSVIGFDNLDWSEHVVPPLTTINLPVRRMGYEVASQLVDHLESAKPILSTLLPGEIIERQSVRVI